MKRMLIAGGTGYLGSVLSANYRSEWEIVILTRSQDRQQDGIRYVQWDGQTMGDWTVWLEGAAVVINLNGKSVDCRYNEKNKKLIYSTRIDSTHAIGQAIAASLNPPEVWINASSATIYRHAEDREMTEDNGEVGEGFSVDVCRKWEAAFNQYKLPTTRKVILRTGIVLGSEGGPFIPLSRMARFGLGGKQGRGTQYISWLHEADFHSIISFIIHNKNLEGVYNVTAPCPVKNSEFMKTMRVLHHIPFGLPAPAWLLEIGAWLIGTETELILKSRRVVPERLVKAGYTFKYPTHEIALKSLMQ